MTQEQVAQHARTSGDGEDEWVHLDPVRAANRVCGRQVFRWQLLSADGVAPGTTAASAASCWPVASAAPGRRSRRERLIQTLAIDRAAQEIVDGHWHGHFPTDMIQGGAGTSTNMNANEVIANRALELLGRPRGAYEFAHPNNHVNLSQSTNDVYPTALKIATWFGILGLVDERCGGVFDHIDDVLPREEREGRAPPRAEPGDEHVRVQDDLERHAVS